MRNSINKELVLFFLLGFWAIHIQAQNPNLNRSNHWYFGREGAGLDFSSGNPTVTSGAAMQAYEGCTSMSDTAGNLLFYTDGMTVWNKLHQPMPPIGIQLAGDPSSTNSAVAFPHPAFSHVYYIVTVGADSGDVYWSLVDMSQNGGLGQVAGSNVLLEQRTSEKLAVTETCDRSNYWTYGFRITDGNFVLIQAHPDSVPLINRGLRCGKMVNDGAPIGQMKFSPNGNFFAVVGHGYSTGFFLFNDLTGEFYHLDSLAVGAYGIEFSKTSTQFFADGLNDYVNIQLDPNFVLNHSYTINTVAPGIEAIQLAKNGKIYDGQGPNLGVFNLPDNPPNFGYQSGAISLNGLSSAIGLPSFPASWFAPERFRSCYSGSCPGEEYNFFISGQSTPHADSVLWNFGDSLSPNNTATGVAVSHTYAQPGIYAVHTQITYGGITDTLVKYVFARETGFSPGVVVDTMVCEINPDLGFRPPFPYDHRFACPQYSQGLEPGVRIFAPGTYYVTWDNGCAAPVTDTFHVHICPPEEPELDMPNILTPNLDGVNEEIILNLKGITELRAQIYNRWGEIVEKQTYYNDGYTSKLINVWDGHCWTAPCSDGVYFYVIDYTYLSGNSKQAKGTITITK